MAAASIVFRLRNPSYSAELLKHARQVFDLDELLWAAAWLYKATNEDYYLDYLGYNGDKLGGTGWAMTEFGWDVKYPGV
ncbi:Endoglucanase [Castilleja foliolosa]|uniref:cellulase n=1 Tax=Castilleja foliolosa TaxID=1961234 RepID=A0ABD3BS96_9LAMI